MKVLIADDHPVVLAGIEAILRDTPYEVIGTAASGTKALEAAARLRPDILLLDVRMPDQGGLDVLRTLRSRGDGRAVVLLTASLTDKLLIDAIELGVQGILLKEGAQNLLVRCLDEVAAGRKWIARELLQKALDLKMVDRSRSTGLRALTPRERAISGLVALGKRNRNIADELGISEGTVKIHLHRVYEKLGVTNRTELAVMARDMPSDP
jgi:two-component system, NarL family, nitrate/nitrite response regulator NarL